MTTSNTQEKHQMIPTATASEILNLAPIARRVGRFLNIVGPAGCGKTSLATTDIPNALGISRVYTLNFTGALPSDVRGVGLPPQDGSRKLIQFAPDVLPLRDEVGNEPYVLVLDEFSDWDSCNTSLFQGLFAPDGQPRVGSHELGRNLFVIITGNRRGDGTRSAPLPAPIVTRGFTVQMKPDLGCWLEWAAEYDDLASSPIYASLHFHAKVDGGELFNPPLPQPWDGSPHPTARTWAALCAATVPNEDGTPNELVADPSQSSTLLTVLESCVGHVAAAKTYAFLQTVASVVPKIEAIRNGSDTLPNNPVEQYSILHTATRIVRSEAADDPAAFVASGKADWFVERVLMCAEPELRRWSATVAMAAGLPLDHHEKCKTMLGLQ